MNNSIITVDSKNFDKEVLRSEKLVALNFFSELCPSCEALEPRFEKMAEKYSDRIKFAKISGTQSKEICKKYFVRYTPTILFFQNGRESGGRLMGDISSLKFESAIRKIVGEVSNSSMTKEEECDVLVLGGGPAGLAAGIYASRARLKTIVIDKGATGGQVAATYHIANYPGTNGIITGKELVNNMRLQAENFGAKIEVSKEILEVNLKKNIKYVGTEDTAYRAKTVIIAAGAEPQKLPAIGEKEFRGKGIHYCAVCDGANYEERDIVVVGGGNSALQEAVYLAKYARHVTIVHQFDHFQASKIAQEAVMENDKIDVIWDSEIKRVNGLEQLQSISIEKLRTKEISTINCDGVFVYIGMQPRVKFLKNQVAVNTRGYIIADQEMRTNLKGVFAAGDIREKSVRQIATAVADGVVAALSAEKYVNRNFLG